MKSKVFKKAGSAVLAAALALNASSFGSVFVSAEETKYEFEDGTLSGCTVQESGTERYQEGASGDKFVFLENGGEIASVTVPVDTAGMYEVILCFSSPYGDKIHNLLVNGVDQGQISCATTDAGVWVEQSLGNVKLNAGDNEIAIKSSWGWTNLDYITIKSAELPEIKAYDTVCCDPDIIPEAQNLMNYMKSVYGEHIISGQQEIYMYGPHDFEYEFDYIQDLTGELPAIRAFDYLNECNILYGSEDGTTDRMIDWVKNKNGIITASWHVTVPKDFASYTVGDTNITWENATYAVWADDAHTVPATDFDTSQILVEGSKEREYWMACLEDLAASIQKLEDQNIPLIFRPLHEAEGGGGETGSWFFWGQDGSEVYKELWKLTYNTLVNDYDLHNIIWEWNSYNYATSYNWYPGDDYVDLIAYDKYNCTDWSTGSAVLVSNDSAISSTFYGIMTKYNSMKMVAMSENDSIPSLSNLIDEKAGWLYFCPWYDGGSDNINFLSNELFNSKEKLTEIYQSEYCITLDELPATLYSEEIATEPTEIPPTTVEPTTAEPTTDDGSFTFELMSQNVDLSGREEGASYEFRITIKGEPTASIGGGLGFGTSADDWVNLEWSGNADADGNLVITIPLDEVPVSITGGQLQVWWSNVWDAATASASDYPCEIISAEVVEVSGETTTEDDSDETTTDDGSVKATLPGDANCNDDVEIADAIAIMSYVTNPEAFPLNEQQMANADVYQCGDGVGINDAVSIQKYITKLISEIPESYNTAE